MIDRDGITRRWQTLGCKLDERGKRLFAANEVRSAGHSPSSKRSPVSPAPPSIAARTISTKVHCRRAVSGARAVVASRSVSAIRRWLQICKRSRSRRRWAIRHGEAMLRMDARAQMGVEEPRQARCGAQRGWPRGEPNTVAKLLEEKLEYSRQFNRKTHEGASHPDRNAQFEHINAGVVAAQAAGQPVILNPAVEFVATEGKGLCPLRANLIVLLARSKSDSKMR